MSNFKDYKDYPEIDLGNVNYRSGISAREQDLQAQLTMPALMRKVYVWMMLAMTITAFTAYTFANNELLLSFVYGSKIGFLGLVIAEVALVVILSAAINRLSLTMATLMFVLYSALNGATLASIFIVYDTTSIATTFGVTAATFGVMAFVGYTTKADLSSMGRILFMALIGVIIAAVVNIFLKSSMMSLAISVIGVLVFVGLTAYDTQKIKQMLMQASDMSEGAQKVALLGALTLYLDFINLFLYLLRFLGKEK